MLDKELPKPLHGETIRSFLDRCAGSEERMKELQGLSFQELMVKVDELYKGNLGNEQMEGLVKQDET